MNLSTQSVNNLLAFMNRVPVTGTTEALMLVSAVAELTALQQFLTAVPAIVPPSPAAERVPAQAEAPQIGDPIPQDSAAA